MLRSLVCFALVLSLSACACLRGPAWVQDSLYFGQDEQGLAISAQRWEAFVAAEVTPRFPDGLTQWPAQGQWQEGAKVLKEGSRVLVLIHAPGADAEAKILAIREAYKKQFHQSSVLRVQEAVKADF